MNITAPVPVPTLLLRHIAPFLMVLVTPALTLLSLGSTGLFAWATVWVLFGIVPVIDHLVGIDRENPTLPPRISRALALWPLLVVPIQLGVMGVGVARVATGFGVEPWLDVLGWALSTGIAGGLSIQVAHELMHRSGWVEQRAADLLMLATCYPHFSIEHVLGHHKHVSTPMDPASSQKGESLYAFLPRTVLGGLVSAWRIEARRAPTWRGNRMVRYAVLQALLLLAFWLTLGPAGILAFLAQAVVAVVLLETVNYVEHYGLSRPARTVTRADGSVEISHGRVLPQHSWNASHRVSNWLLLNLARHSDHHAFAARPYPELRHYDDVPQFPTGYAGMVLLALVPPLWFRVMNPRVEALSA